LATFSYFYIFFGTIGQKPTATSTNVTVTSSHYCQAGGTYSLGGTAPTGGSGCHWLGSGWPARRATCYLCHRPAWLPLPLPGRSATECTATASVTQCSAWNFCQSESVRQCPMPLAVPVALPVVAVARGAQGTCPVLHCHCSGSGTATGSSATASSGSASGSATADASLRRSSFMLVAKAQLQDQGSRLAHAIGTPLKAVFGA